MKGLVKWFNDSKGFGFLVPEDGGKDVFAHYTQIKGEGFKTIKEGSIVEFDRIETERGPEAKNIKIVPEVI